MNLKVPGAILPLGCAILSTRAKTVRVLLQPPLGELGLKAKFSLHIFGYYKSNTILNHQILSNVCKTRLKIEVRGRQNIFERRGVIAFVVIYMRHISRWHSLPYIQISDT